jgi:hypothetical protein
MELKITERRRLSVMKERRFRSRIVFAAIVLTGMLTAGSLIYGETNENVLFIDPHGNVGIGTDKPDATLDVKGRIKDESGFVMPRGGIIMWSGNIADIPKGWALCDGKNGTPDLRGRFIVGADNEKSPRPDEKGEPDSHTHSISPKPLSFNTMPAGEHDHQTCTKYWYMNRTYGAGTGRTVVDARNTDVHLERTSKEGIHFHVISLDLRSEKTGIYDGPNRPRWYALCFIMKL